MKLTPDAESLFRLQEYGKRPTIEGVEVVELRRFNDDGGSLVELLRLNDGAVEGVPGFSPAQVTYSVVEPGVVKAFHVHREQSDLWFVRPEDRVLLVLVDVRRGSATENARLRVVLGDGRGMLVRIPPGVAHGCRNLGRHPASIIYFTDRQFSADPGKSDEGRLPWDFAGKDVWDVAWE